MAESLINIELYKSLSIMYLMKTYLNGFYKYQYLPVSSNLEQKEKEIITDFKNHSNKGEKKKLKKKALTDVKIEFDKHLLNCYIDSSSNNRKVMMKE